MTRNAPPEQWYREGYTVGERVIVLATGFSGVIERRAVLFGLVRYVVNGAQYTVRELRPMPVRVTP